MYELSALVTSSPGAADLALSRPAHADIRKWKPEGNGELQKGEPKSPHKWRLAASLTSAESRSLGRAGTQSLSQELRKSTVPRICFLTQHIEEAGRKSHTTKIESGLLFRRIRETWVFFSRAGTKLHWHPYNRPYLIYTHKHTHIFLFFILTYLSQQHCTIKKRLLHLTPAWRDMWDTVGAWVPEGHCLAEFMSNTPEQAAIMACTVG